MEFSLIANSGVQTFTKIIEINTQERVLEEQFFCEHLNDDYSQKLLDYAWKFSDDVVVAKEELRKQEGKPLLNPDGTLTAEGLKLEEADYFGFGTTFDKFEVKLEENSKDPENVKDDEYYYSLAKNDIEVCIQAYEGKWLPFPYFSLNNDGSSDFGPYGWCRVLIKRIEQEEKEMSNLSKRYSTDEEEPPKTRYQLIVAFDTAINESEYSDTYFTPTEESFQQNDVCYFALCKDEYYMRTFCAEGSYCGWVLEYLKEIYEPQGGKDKIGLYTSYGFLARYLYILKYLAGMESYYDNQWERAKKQYDQADDVREKKEAQREMKKWQTAKEASSFPDVPMYRDDSTQNYIDVTLVLDIGNANTCGLLFESKDQDFDFKDVKRLELKDLSLSHFGEIYDDPFSMRLVFSKMHFGQGKIEHIPMYPGGSDRAFRWPSMVRVGKEARRLINEYNIEFTSDKGETATTSSSPKRYLWDDEPAKVPWEFVNNDLQHQTDASFTGISEQFSDDGEFSYEASFGIEPRYSRKSLMTFVYIEIFLHAQAQINSHEFRKGPKVSQTRKLKRVIITCPTSLVQKEQITLRKCAYEAALALKRFYREEFTEEVDLEKHKPDFDIFPSPDDLAKEPEDRLSWNYDEATCSQLVFLYSELAKKYKGNHEVYFDHFGKRHLEARSSITVASLDIGGGTSDLMINRYESSRNNIKPLPQFWESFASSGDDLLKDIIRALILEGETTGGQEVLGGIRKHAEAKGCSNVTSKIRGLFGKDQPNRHPDTVYRKSINVQLLIPIAIKHLEVFSSHPEQDQIPLKYGDIFKDFKPNEQLIAYIDDYFGSNFSFMDIEWVIHRSHVSTVIRNVFGPLFSKIAVLVQKYHCDFLLISGKLTSLPLIRKMFVEHYPVSPDRIITMHQYNAGDWYTFSHEGRIVDSKTIVPFGAAIAYMGEKNKLTDFSLDISGLQKVKSTADYIGKLNTDGLISKIFLSKNRSDYSTRSFGRLPIVFGYKQFNSESYLGRPIFKLVINREGIKEELERKDRLGNDYDAAIEKREQEINESIDEVNITRTDYYANKEGIEVALYDTQGAEIPKSLFKIKLMTLVDEHHYWADTGEFELFRNR